MVSVVVHQSLPEFKPQRFIRANTPVMFDRITGYVVHCTERSETDVYGSSINGNVLVTSRKTLVQKIFLRIGPDCETCIQVENCDLQVRPGHILTVVSAFPKGASNHAKVVIYYNRTINQYHCPTHDWINYIYGTGHKIGFVFSLMYGPGLLIMCGSGVFHLIANLLSLATLTIISPAAIYSSLMSFSPFLFLVIFCHYIFSWDAYNQNFNKSFAAHLQRIFAQ
jgi:hypothetical protein